MNNLKRKVSLILSVMMLGLVIFPLTIASAASQVTMSVKLEGVEMEYAGTYEVTGGEKITVKASSSQSSIAYMGYYFKDQGYDNMTVVHSNQMTITVPTAAAGTTKLLWVEAVGANDDGSPNEETKTGWQGYYLEYVEKEENNDNFDMDVVVKHDGKTLSDGSTTTVEVGDKIEISAKPSNRVNVIYYVWDKDDSNIREAKGPSCTVTIPTSFAGTKNHSLHIIVGYDNGEFAPQEDYYLQIVEENEPVVEIEDDELDVLPWEKANKDLDCLSISLRNDSESEKANKNVYALEEEVTYFVDFKNGGKDIKDEVKITLELPLTFEVVDSANGIVDSAKGTITWVYPNGMEEEYEGTKTVIVKYTKFDRKSTDSEKIYPVVRIAKKDKEVDNSAVINYIYKDSDTVITDTHEPYMYGDAYATTFRPNDTITRAEGALVLTRILLGQSAIDNVTVTSVYPDLGETYLEAQKAVIAATSYGIINGYEDNYYRPNKAMTRAEFMKILAKFIELDADDEGIDGLRIKDLEETTKLYKDPVLRYSVNGTTVNTHWAIEEVSLLARLNMTSVSSDNKNLRLDEGITRAEVAQLVNFFLLRAPAEVTRRTTTDFSDVNSRHELFADIVEATREAHDFTITEDGTEIAE